VGSVFCSSIASLPGVRVVVLVVAGSTYIVFAFTRGARGVSDERRIW
jgi:hypothetical protein